MAPARLPLAVRFWAKVEQRGPNDCWPWTGARQRKRGQETYGVIRLPGRAAGSEGTHRVAWILHYGPIPEGKHVLHRCDNPPCCNPAHLFLGGIAENNADRKAKGRYETRWSPSSIIEAIRESARLHDRVPTRRELDRDNELPSSPTVRKHFGTYSDALVAAGFPKPPGSYGAPSGGVRRHGPSWRAEMTVAGVRIRKSGFASEHEARSWLDEHVG